jgi:hypothetical protein
LSLMKHKRPNVKSCGINGTENVFTQVEYSVSAREYALSLQDVPIVMKKLKKGASIHLSSSFSSLSNWSCSRRCWNRSNQKFFCMSYWPINSNVQEIQENMTDQRSLCFCR